MFLSEHIWVQSGTRIIMYNDCFNYKNIMKNLLTFLTSCWNTYFCDKNSCIFIENLKLPLLNIIPLLSLTNGHSELKVHLYNFNQKRDYNEICIIIINTLDSICSNLLFGLAQADPVVNTVHGKPAMNTFVILSKPLIYEQAHLLSDHKIFFMLY